MLDKRNIGYVYDIGLCCSCTMCSNYCPKGAITYNIDKRGFYRPIVDSVRCINCGICVSACSGINDLKAYNPTDSKFCYGYSQDALLHHNSSSGGIVTELLCALLDEKIVDYVSVISGITSECRPHPIITADKNVIKECKTSKYCPVLWQDFFKELNSVEGKVAIVGLPCQINSLKKYFSGKKQENKITIYISLFCNHTPSFLATEFLISSFIQSRNVAWNVTYRGQGFPGFIKLSYNDDGNNHYMEFPFRKTMHAGLGKYFHNQRCIVCNDPFCASADISVGDSYFLQDVDTEGTSFCIVRNEQIWNILQKMFKNNIIDIKEGPTKEDFSKSYALLINRESNYKLYNSILCKYEKKCIKSDVPLVKVNIRNYLAFKIRIFKSSIGRFKFLWPLLRIKNRVQLLRKDVS